MLSLPSYRKPAAKIQYYISPTARGNYVDEDDLEIPSYNKMKITFQKNITGIEVVTNIKPVPTDFPSVQKEKDPVC